jgi:diacylglycerol kinase (ATP)
LTNLPFSKAAPAVGVIINPTSGKGVGAKVGARLLELLASFGVMVTDFSAPDAASAASKTREAIDNKLITALFVVGGDGTAQLGVNLCAQTDVALAVVSAGTGNDSARALGLHRA